MHRRVISILVGVLLIVAAALKIYGLNVAPYVQHGWLRDASVQFAAVEWEIVLGVWLLSGHWPAGAWATAVLTFAAFAAVSASLGLSGQASCGCLGAVKSSPWLMFGIDLAVLAMLAVARPESDLLDGLRGGPHGCVRFDGAGRCATIDAG